MSETSHEEFNFEEVNQQPKTSFMKSHQKFTLLLGCCLLSFASGVGGAFAVYKIKSDDHVVMYQAATNKATSDKQKEPGLSIHQIADIATNSVVEIQTESISTNSFFPQAIQSGAGSGVILSKDGYIVTNHHVIDSADKIVVKLKDGKSYDAKLIGSDTASDLAIIKIEAENLSPAIIGSSKALQVGDTAVAIGNPLGELGGTVTSGIISALDREITIDNQEMHLLQTNAAINPGNSGGGLFNDQGQLIGIVNAKSSGENIEGLGFAIPIDRAKDIIENLIANGYVKGRAALGVTLSQASNPYDQNANAIFIVDVIKGQAASKAGLKSGDQILKIDDTDIKDVSDVKTVISNHKAGEKIKMTILRQNSTKTITVTLGEATPDQQVQRKK